MLLFVLLLEPVVARIVEFQLLVFGDLIVLPWLPLAVELGFSNAPPPFVHVHWLGLPLVRTGSSPNSVIGGTNSPFVAFLASIFRAFVAPFALVDAATEPDKPLSTLSAHL